MSQTDFGSFVRALRLQRSFFDEHDFQRPWTQEQLAQESGLSVRQIARIEQNKVVRLEPVLNALATAFHLSEAEKVEFYAPACIVRKRTPIALFNYSCAGVSSLTMSY